MTREQLSLLWAKLGKGSYPEESHPVLCHLVDVGHVAHSLWNRALHGGFRRWLCSELQVSEEGAGQWISYWIALHDIGKVSPAFQRKSEEARLRLTENGLKFRERPHREYGHGIISATVLPTIWEAEHQIPLQLGKAIAESIGGHHGLFVRAGILQQIDGDPYQLGSQAWADARVRVVREIAVALGVETPKQWPKAPVPLPEFITTLTGITEDMIRDAETSDVVLGKFCSWLPYQGILVGHNIAFDLAVVRNEDQQHLLERLRHCVDSLVIARSMCEFPNNRLETIAGIIQGTKKQRQHRAIRDARAVRDLMLHAFSRGLDNESPGLFKGQPAWRFLVDSVSAKGSGLSSAQ